MDYCVHKREILRLCQLDNQFYCLRAKREIKAINGDSETQKITKTKKHNPFEQKAIKWRHTQNDLIIYSLNNNPDMKDIAI